MLSSLDEDMVIIVVDFGFLLSRAKMRLGEDGREKFIDLNGNRLQKNECHLGEQRYV